MLPILSASHFLCCCGTIKKKLYAGCGAVTTSPSEYLLQSGFQHRSLLSALWWIDAKKGWIEIS